LFDFYLSPRDADRNKGATMCPACIAAAALVVAGTASAGGLTAFVVKTLWAKPRLKSTEQSTTTEGGTNGSPESRVTR
jgi:hypothetical protein